MDWRTQWAERENTRRRRTYDAAISRWAQVDGELRSMVGAARDFEGAPAQQVPGWLELKRGERLLWLGSGARLMEAPAWPALAHPGYANLTVDQLIGPFDHAVPVTLNAIDHGPVAVTDRRVVLAGQRRREWAYPKLAGVGHLPITPCTLMYVTNRAKVSGVQLDPRAVAHFRFHLALGLAEGAGDRAGFVAHLERLLGSHQSIRPLPVAAVTAADAPSLGRLAFGFVKTAVVGPRGASAGRRVAHLAATFVALLVLLALLTPDTPQSETLSSGPVATSTPSVTPTSTPTPTPTPTPTEVKEIVTDKQPIPFTTETVDDPSLDLGDRKVRTRGVNGERTITYEVTYVDGEETARQQVGDEVTKEPVNEVVAVGTKEEEPEPEPEPEPESDCHPSYEGQCLPVVDDLNCSDISGEVQVVGPDVYRLDRDKDGTGCDS